jgi:hypothetical protein
MLIMKYYILFTWTIFFLAAYVYAAEPTIRLRKTTEFEWCLRYSRTLFQLCSICIGNSIWYCVFFQYKT